ncbi:hypothetical protein C7T94_08630 [Pedobacter yulinensis]|uniref:Uncharacterized protein n=1 Tax=Pedobacter yulinensis TaxID=2126353 RepID=A0A2T3HK02_9SPHI|nr:hypothetical protein [Pedobacter yulinensis]PST82711.1 hypothetical protein C7T94_08630 [Pedobacter yulinensis]
MRTLKARLSEKSDAQLLYYIQHVDKHTEEAVRLAHAILLERSAVLPSGVAECMETAIAESNEVKEHVVDDPEVPLFYSQSAIYAFSILFSVLFGSFMLAANCRTVGKSGWLVIAVGLLYTVFAGAAVNSLDLNPGLGGSFLINGLGVVLMYEFFWKRHIGKETKYRAKPIWKPLCIGLVLFALLVYLLTS